MDNGKYVIGVIPGMIKRGEKVQVVYNPDKPTEFVVQSPVFRAALIITALIGLIVLGVGVFQLVTELGSVSS